jgi:carbon storage regulator CsrA
MKSSDVGKLVLTLKPGDMVEIGDEVALVVKERSGRETKLLILAPKSIKIRRADAKGNIVQAKSDEAAGEDS